MGGSVRVIPSVSEESCASTERAPQSSARDARLEARFLAALEMTNSPLNRLLNRAARFEVEERQPSQLVVRPPVLPQRLRHLILAWSFSFCAM